MGFGGGGGGGAAGVTVHWHNNETDNGGPLKMRGTTTTGSTFDLTDSGTQYLLECALA